MKMSRKVRDTLRYIVSSLSLGAIVLGLDFIIQRVFPEGVFFWITMMGIGIIGFLIGMWDFRFPKIKD